MDYSKSSVGALGAWVALALALAASTAGCARGNPPQQAGAATVVPTVTAQQGTVTPRTSLPGIIAPLQNVGITSTLSEAADRVPVKEGDLVQRGQLLAQLDTADLRAQLAADIASIQTNQARQTQTYDQASLTISQSSNIVNQARAALRQWQQTLATDTLNLTRYAELVRNGYISQQQYDAQASAVKNDQEAVRAAQVTLQNDISQVRANGTTSTGLQGSQVQAAIATTQMTQAQADQIRVSIVKATIVSPIDGIVINRNLNPGEYPGTRQIFTLQETDRVYAVLNGSASAIAGMQAGNTVIVAAATLPGRQFTGRVDGILNPINPGSTNFIVKVLLANAHELLRPGMPVSGVARLASVTGLRIPATAFLDTTNSTVQTVSNGLVHTAKVTMMAQDGQGAIVTGLAPGTAVISNGQLGLTDGQTVQPQIAQE
jgi:multidrug efflux pump subunit AcrA (membrane-fusion protein)